MQKFTKYALPLWLLFMSLSPVAQQSEPHEKCDSIKASSEWLKCFDTIQSTPPPPRRPVKIPTKNIGLWKINSTISKIDDSHNITLTLKSQISYSTISGPQRASLIFRCKEQEIEAFISWGLFIGLDAHPVLMRIDKDPANVSYFSVSTDREAVFFDGNTADLIENLSSRKKLFVEITPYGDNPKQALFLISGLTAASDPLKAACRLN